MDALLAQVADLTGLSNANDAAIQPDKADAAKQDLFKLLARCNLKLGQWQATIVEESNPVRCFLGVALRMIMEKG